MNNVDTSFAYILLQYKLRMFIRHTFSEATFVKLEAYCTWISYGKGIIPMNFDVQQNNTYGIKFYRIYINFIIYYPSICLFNYRQILCGY